MKTFVIDKSHEFNAPGILFDLDRGELEIEGSSYLERPNKFYKPVFEFLREELFKLFIPIKFNFKINYFNSSSSKCILEILNILKDFEEQGGSVVINWHYDGTDIELEEEIDDLAFAADIAINHLQYEPASLADSYM